MEEKKLNIYEKQKKIQRELKCNKGQYNSFGNYRYRSCEDILESVKPLLQKYDLVILLGDDIIYTVKTKYLGLFNEKKIGRFRALSINPEYDLKKFEYLMK